MAGCSQESNLSVLDREYFFVILFEWSENNPNPVFVVVRDCFAAGEIPDSWFTKKLQEEHRQQKTSFLSLKNRVFSVFAKCEKGIKNYSYIPITKCVIYNCLFPRNPQEASWRSRKRIERWIQGGNTRSWKHWNGVRPASEQEIIPLVGRQAVRKRAKANP